MRHPSLYYILDEDLCPVRCEEWDSYYDWHDKMPESSEWYSGKTGIGFTLAVDEVGDDRVSTVYLGMDHGFDMNGEHGPILWETMVFPDAEVCERYRSREQAIAGHRKIVEQIKTELRSSPQRGTFGGPPAIGSP